MKPLVVVWAKPPVPGAVKTRLAKAVGDEAAARLAKAFFLDTWKLVGSVDCDRIIASTSEDAAELLGAPGAEVWQQGEGDLATRLHRIFDEGLRRSDRVISLGADSPGLPREQLVEALKALETNDAVIGPAEDGGFYLVGLTRCPPRLFDEVALSTARARETLRSALRAAAMTFSEVGSWFDVDEPADLPRLTRVLSDSSERAVETTAALRQLIPRP